MEWLLTAFTGSMATIGVLLLSNLVKTVLAIKQYREAPQQFMLDQGYSHAQAGFRLIKPFLNEDARSDLVDYASGLPDYYDAGWDAALEGKPKPKLENVNPSS